MVVEMATNQDRSAPVAQGRGMQLRSWMFWVYLLMIALAEVLTFTTSPQAGQAIHAVLLIGMVLYGGLASSGPYRKLALALALAPLTRILSLSLPLLRIPQLAWYPVVTVPLLVATWLIIRQGKFSSRELGFHKGNLALQIMLAGAGAGLGWVEYLILAPQPLVPVFSWTMVGLAAIILALSTGFPEELIFRGVLQSAAIPVLGRWGIVYVSLLFAALHIGYLSVPDVIFVFLVGLSFAYIVRNTGSILGVTLVHALTNIFLFLVMPYVAQDTSGYAQQITLWVALIGSILALDAAVLLMWNIFPKVVRTAAIGASAPVGVIDWDAALLLDDSPQAHIALYQQLTGDTQPPLLNICVAVDTPVRVTASLFVPSKRDAANRLRVSRLQMYCNDIPLNNDYQLLPHHFDYIEGVVAIDLSPAQIASGVTLNDDTMQRIGRVLSKQLTRELSALADTKTDAFRLFWSEFGTHFSDDHQVPSDGAQHHQGVAALA